VYVPGRFNRNKDKLFFFYSGEFWWTAQAQPLRQFTMPTALERVGDFSQTVDLNRKLIPIRDPLSGQPFPLNIIPSNRINADGQRLLNVFPLPNFTNSAVTNGQYNYVFQESVLDPKHEHVLRADYNASSKTALYFRGAKWWEDYSGVATPLSNALW